MLRTFPVAGSFCNSCLEDRWYVVGRRQEGAGLKGRYHVLIKSQSGRCFFVSFGSVEEGQCYFWFSRFPLS